MFIALMAVYIHGGGVESSWQHCLTLVDMDGLWNIGIHTDDIIVNLLHSNQTMFLYSCCTTCDIDLLCMLLALKMRPEYPFNVEVLISF